MKTTTHYFKIKTITGFIVSHKNEPHSQLISYDGLSVKCESYINLSQLLLTNKFKE